MRLALALAAAAMVAPGLLSSPADAASRRVRVCDYGSGGVYACHWRYARGRDTSDPGDYDRAKNLDPAGDYRHYPAWARRALSPKFDNGFR